MADNEAEPEKTNRPPADAFRQQKLKAWQPIMTPLKVVVIFIVIGVAFIPTGFTLIGSSNAIYQKRVMYDGDEEAVSCSIDDDGARKDCTLSFGFNEDVDGPIYVYYELENFYQNHRKYVSSRDTFQLAGEDVDKSTLETTCESSYENGSLVLNPCGLIANSFFTDIITIDTDNSSPSNIKLDEDDIAWPSDDDKFKQPDGFESKKISDASTTCSDAGLPNECKLYNDTAKGQLYLFYYPDDDDVQYLYESYPLQISPIDGVTDEHFKVWMRVAALPTFRKLYGKIDHDFKDGDKIVFNVEANFEVDSFDGSKSIVISNLGEFGGQNPYLGVAYVVVGCISLMFALLFLLKQAIAPRAVADPSLLHWN